MAKWRLHPRRTKSGHRCSAHHRKKCLNCKTRYPKTSRLCPICGSGDWRPTEH